MAPTLVLATRNLKKLEELRQLLSDLPLELADLSKFAEAPEVVEDGETFLANAQKKAEATAVALGQWVLAEDSGLVVPSLGGRPGVHSARYAGRQGDDEANNDKLLAELSGSPDADRSAYYVCVAVLADPSGVVQASAEGRCRGRIVSERRGCYGFGYDPLFLIPEYHRTFGELGPTVKQAISHRARALARLRPEIIRLLRLSGGTGRPEDTAL